MPIIPVRNDKISASFIIAAPDSTNPNRADFKVPQGSVNAENTINQAINNLGSSGGKIFLLDGNYTISNPIILPDNVTLEGFREASKITIPNGLDKDINAIENYDPSNGNNNITILNLSIDMNKVNQTAGVMNGIKLFDGFNVRISRVTSSNARTNGIEFDTGNQLTVNECITDNNDNDGILYSGTAGGGIYKSFSFFNTNNGIELVSLTRPSLVSDNVCISNSNNGIGLFSLARSNVSENVCRNNGDHGIVGFDITNSNFTNNNCFDNGIHGIDLIQSNFCLLEGNNCLSNRDGIVFDTADSNSLFNNNCHDNRRNGINIFSASFNNIVGNTCINNSVDTPNTNDNILVSGTAGDSAENNNLQENKVRSGGNARYGINLGSNAINNQTTNNDFRNGGVTANFNDVEGNPTSPGNIPDGGAGLAAAGVTVEMQGTQTIAGNGIADIAFDTEIEDLDNMWDSGTPTDIVVNTAGTYIVTFYVRWSLVSSPTNGFASRHRIELNGTEIVRSAFHNNSGQDFDAAIEDGSVSGVVIAQQGDIITGEVNNRSDSDNDVTQARLSAYKVAGT